MNKVRKYRIEKGYKLSEFAQLVGVSTGYMCHLEKGNRTNPSYKVMCRIANVLEKELSEIF